MSVRIVALLVVLAGSALAPSNASAFGHLFGHRAAGCDACGCAAAPSCGCEIAAPTCGCEIACDPCADPCGKPKRMGLFARLKAKHAAKKASCCDPCAAPTCGCEVIEPTCGCEMGGFEMGGCGDCFAEPTCGCEIAAPSCGCEVSCCDPCAKPKKMGLFARLKAKHAAKKASCCDPCAAPTCGCEIAAPTCGCEIASCGCGM